MRKLYFISFLALLAACSCEGLHEDVLFQEEDEEDERIGSGETRAATINFYTTKGISVRNSGIGPETWYGSTTPYVPYMVKFSDGESKVANSLIRLHWSDVEDENGYHFEEAFDNCFMQAYFNKQKICLGIFPLDSYRGNDVEVNAEYKGRQYKALIGYPKYIHNQLMKSEQYRPRLYQNFDGSITDRNAPLYYAPDLRNPIVKEKYHNLLTAFRAYLDKELVFDGKRLCRRMLVREIQMRYWGCYGEGLYNYIGPNREYVTITADSNPEFDMETSADLIEWGHMFTEIFPDIRLIAPSNIFWQTGGYAEFQYWLATASNDVGEFGLFYDMWGEDSMTAIAETATVWNGQKLKDILKNKWRKAPIGGETWMHLPEADYIPYSTIPEQFELIRPARLLAGNLTLGDEAGNTTHWRVSDTEFKIFKDAYSMMGFRIIANDADYTLVERGHFRVVLFIQNIGRNPVYEPWDIYFVLRNPTTKKEEFAVKSSFDIRTLMPSDNANDVLKVRKDWTDVRAEFTNIPKGKYEVYLRICDPDGIVPNMRLAQDGYNENGEYFVMTVVNY